MATDNAVRVARMWRRVRWAAVVFCVVQFAMYDALLVDKPYALLPTGLAIGLAETIVNISATRHETRRPRTAHADGRPAPRDLALLALDFTFIASIVLLFAFYAGSTWVLLVIPVLQAGLLGRLRLSVWTWLLAVSVVVTEAFLAVQMFGSDASAFEWAASVMFRSGVLLLVALVVGFAAVISNEYVQLLRRVSARLEHQATHDDLTQLPARSLLMDRAEAAMRRRRSGERVAVAFVDCDRFKDVNDRHGHAAGDAVLAQVAARLVDVFRPGDTVARLGGDEFVVLMPGVELAEAEVMVATAVKALAKPYDVPGDSGSITMTCTVGLALTDRTDPGAPDDETLGDLLGRADADMYASKGLASAT